MAEHTGLEDPALALPLEGDNSLLVRTNNVVAVTFQTFEMQSERIPSSQLVGAKRRSQFIGVGGNRTCPPVPFGGNPAHRGCREL